MKHEVTFDIPTRELGKADTHFTVKQNGEGLGKLEVSRGAFVWYPKNFSYGHKLSRSDFDEAATKFPRSERRKKR